MSISKFGITASSNFNSVSTEEAELTLDSLQMHSMMDVYEAIHKGHVVYELCLDLNKEKVLGPKQHVGFCGGQIMYRAQPTAGAFIKFSPTGLMRNKLTGSLEEIPNYVMSVWTAKEQVDWNEVNKNRSFKDKMQCLESTVSRASIGREMWEETLIKAHGLYDPNIMNAVPGILFEMNPGWDSSFVLAFNVLKNNKQIRSMNLFIVLPLDAAGNYSHSEYQEIIKPNGANPVSGYVFQPQVVACFFKNTTYGSRLTQQSAAATTMQATLKYLELAEQERQLVAEIKKAGKSKGNKALKNAKTAFEDLLNSSNKWNTNLEETLKELAASSQFPTWTVQECRVYLLKMHVTFPDAEMDDTEVNSKKRTKNTTDVASAATIDVASAPVSEDSLAKQAVLGMSETLNKTSTPVISGEWDAE